MTIEQMREEVMAWYPSDKWREKVSKMPDRQIIALFYKRLEASRMKGDER